MDKDLQKYYESRFEMLSSDGWKDLIEDVEVLEKPLKDIKPIKTEQELYFRKGQLDIISWFLNIKDMTEAGYANFTIYSEID